MVSEQTIVTILYNILFIGLFVFWIYQEKVDFKKLVLEGNRTYWWFVAIAFFNISFLLNAFVLKSDVDDAVISGTRAFIIDGVNPYIENVVIHYLNGEEVLGLYHYFPSDLLVNSFFFIILSPLELISPLFINSWFVLANGLFLILSYAVIKSIIDQPDTQIAPLYIIFTSPFLFTNSSLMILYFVIGFYLFTKVKSKTGGIILYILAAGVKYMTGLFLIVHLLEELKNKEPKEILNTLIPYIVGGIVFLVTIIPFGVIEVLEATFLYQGDITARSEVAQLTGPFLLEIALFFNIVHYYNLIFLTSAILSLLIAFYYGRDTYEKQMILSFLFMFILPFYGTELFAVSLLLWYFKLFDIDYQTTTS